MERVAHEVAATGFANFIGLVLNHMSLACDHGFIIYFLLFYYYFKKIYIYIYFLFLLLKYLLNYFYIITDWQFT